MKLETDPNSFLSDKIAAMLWNNRKALAIIVAIGFVCSVVVAFIIPVKYKASTVIFASMDNNLGHSLFSGSIDERDYMAFGEEKACEQMMQVLTSETVMRAMDKKFDLMHYYKIAPDEHGKYSLMKYYYKEGFSFDITEYESIEVDVVDRDPKMAAVFANAVVQIADSMYSLVVKQHAAMAFAVVKEQYDSSMRVSNRLEDSMNVYRNKGMLDYKYQVKELTKGYADAIVKGSSSSIKDMEDKLSPFREYGKQYATLDNALQDNYKWMQHLKEIYIEAKTNLNNTVSPFFVLEKAIPADKKYSPIRWLVVVGGTFAGLLFGIFLLLVMRRLSPRN